MQQGTSLATHWRLEFRDYGLDRLRCDLTAGATVCMLLIPQALAYALLAGVPLQAGLISAAFGTAISAAFGSSRHLISGPTNATAILIQTGILSTLVADYGGEPRVLAQLLMELTLLVGAMQMAAGVSRLGRLSSLIRPSVTLGYIIGAAIALSINQFFTFFGLPKPEATLSIWEKGGELLWRLPESHLLTVVVGVASACFYLVLCRRLPKLPNAIVMLAASVGGSLLLGWEPQPDGIAAGASSHVALVGDMGGVDSLWRAFQLPLPLFSHLFDLLPLAVAITILASVESVSVSRTVANSSGQDPSLNRDVGAMGVANICCALLGGMPNSGSPSRSALNFALGAKTRASAMVAGMMVLVVVALCGGLIPYIPLSSLSALLLVTVLGRMISPTEIFAMLRRGWNECLVLGAMVLTTLFVGLDTAFFVGCALSLARSR